MNVTTMVINTAAKLLLDSRLWIDAKMFVTESQMDSNLTGSEKRSRVKQNLLLVLGDIGDVLLNLSIEMAVYWLKSKQK